MNKEIGELLKKKRQDKGLSIEDVYKSTKIQPGTIRYLEEGTALERLGPVYTKSFLKLYSKFLGIDLGLIIKEEQSPAVKVQTTESEEKKRPSFFKELVLDKINFTLPTFKLPYGNLFKIIVPSILVLLLIFILSAKLRHKDERIVPKKVTKTASAPASTKKATKTAQEISVKVADKLSLLIRAKEDSWLQVKCDSKVVFQRLLTKGSVEKWEAKEKINLWVGNAAGLVVELNGQNIGSLGRRGQVIKNITITKQGVSIGK